MLRVHAGKFLASYRASRLSRSSITLGISGALISHVFLSASLSDLSSNEPLLTTG